MDILEATYNPKNYEDRIWDFWHKNKFFHAKVDETRTPYTILMPPPNITSQLHMGHGTGYSIQDLLIRWKRMKGFNACWLPGTDHAGIATQMMVEKSLVAEGLTRKQLGRAKFEERLHAWKDKYGSMIIQQFAKMGFSCDWERLAYTMDPKLSEAVRYVFVKLYEEGLIYRGERLVNWDVVLQTAVSDDELENTEVNGFLYHFRYPIDGSDEMIPIATTRPETMLGDTAVAVNPEDERFRHLIGKHVRMPFTNRLIPIIADDYVKSEFGTGAVKITPAHDPNDFEIGKRHNLPFITVLNDDGTMAANCPERFRDMERFAARKEIVKALKELGLFDEEKPYRHVVPHSERSKTIIEPKLSLQWYVRMASLAKPAADAARDGSLRLFPDTWKKTYLYWLDNIQDWCISRQLWWGHRIPIWYCQSCHATTSGMSDPSACQACGSKDLRQDEDVLDTWFSSWLWPLSPFGWPEKTPEDIKTLAYFYPSNVLVTAPEIIFLWVARMVMVGLKFKGEVPFQDVYFNATVCDKKGRKFSKTLGNGIDPIGVIDRHGADAVRFTAVSLAPLGGRVRMDIGDFENGARFVNKIWNAARFLFRSIDADTRLQPLASLDLNLAEKWLVNELAVSAQKIDQLLENYRINEAVETAYHFMWGSLCDWGLECAKDALNSDNRQERERVQSVLVYAFEGALRLLHPVIPFITEEIWQKMPRHPDWDRPEALTIAKFPEASRMLSFPTESRLWTAVQDVISGIRSVRSQSGITPRQELDAIIRADVDFVPVIQDSAPLFRRLSAVNRVTVSTEVGKPRGSLSHVGKGFEVYLPVEGLLDVAKEKARLEAEWKRVSKIVDGLNAKLSNKDFMDRAPEEVVVQTREQLTNMSGQLGVLKTNIESLT